MFDMGRLERKTVPHSSRKWLESRQVPPTTATSGAVSTTENSERQDTGQDIDRRGTVPPRNQKRSSERLGSMPVLPTTATERQSIDYEL